jgi:RHS repeat-associated protein
LRATFVAGLFPDSVYEIVRDGARSYPLFDGVGSVTTLTDATGAVVGRVRYSAFGVPHSSGVTENTVSFTGHQFNTATGLFFARARYYDPTLGRFLSQDPEWAVNLYVYALNAPLTFTDPTGRAASIEDEINRIKGQLANLRASNKRGIFNDLIKQLEKRLEELAKIERDQWHGVPRSR